MDTVKRYLDLGIDRVILGTAAVTNPEFAEEAVQTFGDKIAVGVDMKNGKAAIKGWTEESSVDGLDLLLRMAGFGIKTAIVTDISRDGAMQGANIGLYDGLQEKTGMNIIASGGVSNLDDVKALRAFGLHGAIIGKAYYSGAVDLAEAVECAK
jgi:phosphoribosylformimino-5-aminoimidazole carboxamide ribotide isomerase